MLNRRFEKEDRDFDIRKRGWSALLAFGLTGVILLFLFLWVIATPNPPFPENMGGIAVNFGHSDVGAGDEQAFTYTPVETVSPSPAAAMSAQENQESLVEQDVEDAPVIAPKPVKPTPAPQPKPVPNTTSKPLSNPTPTPAPKPAVDQNALFNPGALGKPNNSTGDGEGGGKGDQGRPDGDPFSSSYQGNGSGDGVGSGSGSGLGDGNVRLNGRSTKVRAKPEYRCEAKGKVNIEIQVDRGGHVVRAEFLPGGSTTSDACLVREAVAAARKFQFNESPGSAEIQKGSILFTFKVQ
jgi:protein TonB